MEYTLEDIRKLLYSDIDRVADVFRDFFEEPYVDCQYPMSDEDLERMLHRRGFAEKDGVYDISHTVINTLLTGRTAVILVWWPSVTVTNENGRSVEIEDLYAKMEISPNGYLLGGPLFNRATYSSMQYASNYMHSHIPTIPKREPSCFQLPCLGRGPIRNTIHALRYSSDNEEWMLFCKELSMYVTVESLKGVPYKKLEEIGTASSVITHSEYYYNRMASLRQPLQDIKSLTGITAEDIIRHYLSHGDFKLSYICGNFLPGIPYYRFVAGISNSFLSLLNERKVSKDAGDMLFRWNILVRCLMANGRIYNDVMNTGILDNESPVIMYFKGHPVRLRVYEEGSRNSLNNMVVILKSGIAMGLLHIILGIVNITFKNKQYENNGDKNHSSATCKKVCCL